MGLQRSDFSYDLDQKYIAQTPVTPRDSSKLLQLNRSTTKVTHWRFSDLPQLLQPGDVLVRNNTKCCQLDYLAPNNWWNC
jgi:S-adenosylmethionine:tRNA ribosyltransferase-isomerase